jgi:hypothetical protein
VATQRRAEREPITVAKHPVDHGDVWPQPASRVHRALDAVGFGDSVAAQLEDKLVQLARIAVIVHHEHKRGIHDVLGSSRIPQKGVPFQRVSCRLAVVPLLARQGLPRYDGQSPGRMCAAIVMSMRVAMRP